jgi:hypothetical protein
MKTTRRDLMAGVGAALTLGTYACPDSAVDTRATLVGVGEHRALMRPLEGGDTFTVPLETVDHLEPGGLYRVTGP